MDNSFDLGLKSCFAYSHEAGGNYEVRRVS